MIEVFPGQKSYRFTWPSCSSEKKNTQRYVLAAITYSKQEKKNRLKHFLMIMFTRVTFIKKN